VMHHGRSMGGTMTFVEISKRLHLNHWWRDCFSRFRILILLARIDYSRRWFSITCSLK
jgi:hypothetical protein